MSFSAGKRNKQVNNALQPFSFNSPFGGVNIWDKDITFTPGWGDNTGIKDQMQAHATKLPALLNSIPTEMSVNDLYNNPFYESTKNILKAPVERQRQQEMNVLRSNLNARNQIGSSYDALQHHFANQRYDDAFRGIEDQARNASANAFQQAFGNKLNALAAIRGDQGAMMEQVYAPVKLAMGYQGALNPLGQSAAAYYGQGNGNPLGAVASIIPAFK